MPGLNNINFVANFIFCLYEQITVSQKQKNRL